MPKNITKKTIAFTGLALFIFPLMFILWEEITNGSLFIYLHPIQCNLKLSGLLI